MRKPNYRWPKGDSAVRPADAATPQGGSSNRVPATPLPWQAEDIGQGTFSVRGDGNGHCVVFTNSASKSRHAVKNGIHGDDEERQNAAYIVHACNNYGRVVTALRDIHNLIASYPKHFNAHEVNLSQYMENTNALLRELGEL